MKYEPLVKGSYIIVIKCSDTHFEQVVDAAEAKNFFKNSILNMVEVELGLDCYYVNSLNLVMVRVDFETI